MLDGPDRGDARNRTTINGDGSVIGDHSQSKVIKDSTIIEKMIIEASEPSHPYQIPRPPKDFKDRDKELDDILAAIEAGTEIIALRGIGGVGKTDLALVLAGRLKEHYSDSQLFLDMLGTRSSSLKPVEAMAQVVRAYRPETRMPDDSNEMRGLYLSVLANRHALLLVDNAASREQVEPLLPPEGCIMLITSRQRFALPGMKTVDLDVLPEADACNLLIANASRIGEHAKEMAELCGYLPLALRNASSVLAENIDVGVMEYLRRLQDAKKRLDLVDASFSLSYDLLSLDKRELWCMLSVFPADFDRAGATAVWNMEPDEAAEALSELVKWSLVNFLSSPGSEEGRYRLHDLARLFASARQSEESKAIVHKRHAAYYKELLSTANSLYEKGGSSIQAGLALFDREQMNIKGGQAWAEGQIGKAKEISRQRVPVFRLCEDYSAAGVYVLDLRLHPAEKIGWFEASLRAARALKDRNAEGVHLGNLGLAYADLGDARKAIEYYEQQLVIAHEIGDRKGDGNALGNLGNAYADLGDVRKAIDYYEQALEIDREIVDRRGEGTDLGNLGVAYKNLGDAKKSIEYYEQALEIAREIGNRMGEGNALGNLGIAYYLLGDTKKAIEYYEQVLTINREIGDRRNEGNTLGNLGIAYAALGDAKKAIVYYEQQLKLTQEIGDRRGEGNALWNMSLALHNLDKPSEAIKKAESALQIYKQIESPAAARVKQQLAEWRK